MTGALKVVSVERGYDPKDFTLVAFGGAGPLHGVELGRALGCRAVLVPRYPGLLCALGLLATDLQYDYARTALQRGPDYDLAAIDAVWRELEQEADEELAREGIPAERRRFVRLADLRYAKQGFELTLEAPASALDAAAAARLVDAFHTQHERLYTFAERETQVEIVTLRLRAIGLVDKIALPEIAAAAGSKPEAYERRAVRLDGASHRRSRLPARRTARWPPHQRPRGGRSARLDKPRLSRADRRGRPPRQPDHPAGLTHAQSRHRHARTDQGRHPVGTRRRWKR